MLHRFRWAQVSKKEKDPRRKLDLNLGVPLSRRTPQPLGQERRFSPGPCFLVGYLTAVRPNNMHVDLSDGSARINCTCSHSEVEVADQTCYLTQSQSTDTGSANPSADHVTQSSTIVKVTGMTRPGKATGDPRACRSQSKRGGIVGVPGRWPLELRRPPPHGQVAVQTITETYHTLKNG